MLRMLFVLIQPRGCYTFQYTLLLLLFQHGTDWQLPLPMHSYVCRVGGPDVLHAAITSSWTPASRHIHLVQKVGLRVTTHNHAGSQSVLHRYIESGAHQLRIMDK